MSALTGGNKIPKGYSLGKLNQFTPEQTELFSSLFSQVSPNSFLSQIAGGDQQAFNEVEAPALQQFNEIQGNLASRFSGMGRGARRSSGFMNASNQAASDFSQQLSSNRLNMRMQALQELMGFSNQLLNQKPYEQFLTEKQKPWWQEPLTSFAGGIGQGLGQGAGAAMGKFF